MEEARQRKQSKYQDLVDEATEAGFCTELITLEIGSRGMIIESELSTIQAAFVNSRHEINHLAVQLIKVSTARLVQDMVLQKPNSFLCTNLLLLITYIFSALLFGGSKSVRNAVVRQGEREREGGRERGREGGRAREGEREREGGREGGREREG